MFLIEFHASANKYLYGFNIHLARCSPTTYTGLVVLYLGI